METEQEAKQGLELLSDETLAGIVQSEMLEDDKLSTTGQCAFDELYRRDPNTGH